VDLIDIGARMKSESLCIRNSRSLAIYLHVNRRQIYWLLQMWYLLSMLSTAGFYFVLGTPVPEALACGMVIFGITLIAAILITFLHEIGHYIACRLAGTDEQCEIIMALAGQCVIFHKQFSSPLVRAFVAFGGPLMNIMVGLWLLQSDNLWHDLVGWISLFMGAETLMPVSLQTTDDELMSDGTLVMANICDWLGERDFAMTAEGFSLSWFVGSVGATVYVVYGFLDTIIKIVVSATTMIG
jgi:hypothetical protein